MVNLRYKYKTKSNFNSKIIQNKTHWKEIYQQDIEEKLRVSYDEYLLYKKTNEVVYLQQAGNKLFSIVENYLMLKYKSKVNTLEDIWVLINNNDSDAYLLSESTRLHYFYYENITSDDPKSIEYIYKKLYKKLKNRIKIK